MNIHLIIEVTLEVAMPEDGSQPYGVFDTEAIPDEWGHYDSCFCKNMYVISLYGSVAKTDGRFMILVRLPSPFLPQIRIRIAQMNSDFL